VLLETAAMEPGRTYRLTVSGARDVSSRRNEIEPAGVSFRHRKPTWTHFDLDGSDDTQIVLNGPEVAIATRAESDVKLSRNQRRGAAPAGVVRKDLAGDFTFVVTVTSQTKSSRNAKSGIVLARSMDDLKDHRFVTVSISPDGSIMLYRLREHTDPRTRVKASIETVDFPVWLRLRREGKTYAASYSTAGVGADDWVDLGSFRFLEPADAPLVGVFNDSGTPNRRNVAQFDLRGRPDEVDFTDSTDEPAR
jgi:hypothetical protein